MRGVLVPTLSRGPVHRAPPHSTCFSTAEPLALQGADPFSQMVSTLAVLRLGLCPGVSVGEAEVGLYWSPELPLPHPFLGTRC